MNRLNVLQTISVVGIIFAAIAHFILLIIGKHVDSIWALYPTWAFIFIVGTLIKKYSKEEDHHH